MTNAPADAIAERLGEVAAELYAADAEDFVAIRTERATALRKAGDRELAKAVAALRRPTRSAWVVNLLAREADEEVQALLDLGAALREAQQALSGPDLRRLSSQRHRAVEALAGRAVSTAAEHGVAVTDAVRREVVQALQVALADEDVAAQVRVGQLAQVPSYGGFGLFGPEAPADEQSAAPPAPAKTTAKTKTKTGGRTQAQDDGEQQDDERAAARAAELERRRSEAAEELEAAGQASAQAETEVNDAESALERLREAEAELRAAVERARGETEEAERALREAGKQLEERQAAERAAQQKLDALVEEG